MASEEDRNGGAVGPDSRGKSSHRKESKSASRKTKGSSHQTELESGKPEEASRKSSSAGKVKKRKLEANGKSATEAVGDHRNKHKTTGDGHKVREMPDPSSRSRHHVSEGDASGGKILKQKKEKGTRKEKHKASGKPVDNATKPDTQSRGHQGRDWTVSIAVAGSIVDNAQSLELATAVSGWTKDSEPLQ